MKAKCIAPFLCAVVFAVAVPAFAETPEGPDVLYLSRAEALNHTLDNLPMLTEIDRQLREMPLITHQLQTQLTRLESRFPIELQLLNRQLENINSQHNAAAINQVRMQENAANAMQNLQETIANLGPGTGDELASHLQFATQGMVAAQGMGGSLAALDVQRHAIMAEIAHLNDRDRMDEMARNARRNLNELERQETLLQLQRRLAVEAAEHLLYTLLTLQQDLYFRAGSLVQEHTLAQTTLRRTEVLFQLGLVNQNQLDLARYAVRHAEIAALENTRNALSIRHSINELLGLPLSQPVTVALAQTPEETAAFPWQDADALVADVLPTLPAVLNAQFALDRALEARWVYSGHHRSLEISARDWERAFVVPPNLDTWRAEMTREEEQRAEIRNRIALEEAITNAEIHLESAQRHAEATLRRALNDYEGLRAQEEALRLALSQAQTALHAAQADHAVGLATYFDVQAAQTEVFFVQQQLLMAQNHMGLQVFLLHHPRLL